MLVGAHVEHPAVGAGIGAEGAVVDERIIAQHEGTIATLGDRWDKRGQAEL